MHPESATARLDHLVYATPDLDATIADLHERLGVRAVMGGSHPGRGTRNALIGLSEFTYLEIVGPDPTQPIVRPRWFSLDLLTEPRLVTWAAKSTDLDALLRRATANGVALGRVASGARRTASGALLEWSFTDPTTVVEDGIVPFFIDWGTSPHPASNAPRGPTLTDMRAEHPDAERVANRLTSIGIDLHLDRADRSALIATFETPRGVVELR